MNAGHAWGSSMSTVGMDTGTHKMHSDGQDEGRDARLLVHTIQKSQDIQIQGYLLCLIISTACAQQ